jgi:hypothetical protein
MATVAILLCLVLITTSVVSGIFARFTIYKKSETSVSFQSFGVTVELTPNSNLKTKSEVKKGDSASVMFEELPMAPGDKFYEALCIDIEGTPNVPIIFRATCHIEYNMDQYKSGDDSYMPLGFTIQYEDDDRNDICASYKKNHGTETLEEIIVRNIYNKLFGTKYTKDNKIANVSELDSTSKDYYFIKEYDTTMNFTDDFDAFYLGFEFPNKNDAIATALSENAAGYPITIIFSFTIEQA